MQNSMSRVEFISFIAVMFATIAFSIDSILPALPEKQVQKGHVHSPNGFGTKYPDPDTGELKVAGVNINELTDAQDRDPFTGCPHFKYVRCNVERVERSNTEQKE